MDRRTFVTNSLIAAAALLLGGCGRYRRVDNPDPIDWTDRNREWDWLDDDDHFPDRGLNLRDPNRDSDRARA
ncbi:MAG: hypothetical protein OEO83_06450 [Alphaproteobacteria bacterium]|nr:hypothetical protein [Alphaproteobacteria bacterium]